MKKALLSLATLLLAVFCTVSAQPSKQYITVYAEPDHADWVYTRGQAAELTLYAVKENVRMPLTEIEYSYGPEKRVLPNSACPAGRPPALLLSM